MEYINWSLITSSLYFLFLVIVCLRVIWDTQSVSKTLAYLLLIIFVPIFGLLFYFSFGINYRKQKLYSKKLKIDTAFQQKFEHQLSKENLFNIFPKEDYIFQKYKRLIHLFSNSKTENAFVLPNYQLTILNNGENLYPKLFEELKKARKHIHLEYYIYDDDVLGNQLKDILIQKAKEGVEIRFIYDDFGSKNIRKTIAKELREAGVKVFPFHKIRLMFLANRLNYRNHRKIVIIDGETAFVGGINVSDKYINQPKNKVYWRDTHLMIKGFSALSLQHIFLLDWNFCSGETIEINEHYFPFTFQKPSEGNFAQVIVSGPDSDMPSILYALLIAIGEAKEEILLTTPYYIPENTLQEALIIAAKSGVKVKLLLPKKGDSAIVDVANRSFFAELLEAGVEIYCYKKGFIHSKTFVIDGELASVGTTNLDIRSFTLNFEVSALLYDSSMAQQLRADFYTDLQDSEKISAEVWNNSPKWKKLIRKIVKLASPFM